MPEDKEYPVVDGAPLNPYDVDTSGQTDEAPEGDVAKDRDAMTAPADELAAAVPGPGGDPSGVTTADTDGDDEDADDEKPARRRKTDRV